MDAEFEKLVRDVKEEIHKCVDYLKCTVGNMELGDRSSDKWLVVLEHELLHIFFDDLHHEIVFEKADAPPMHLTLRVTRSNRNYIDRPIFTALKFGQEQGKITGLVLVDLVRQAVETLVTP